MLREYILKFCWLTIIFSILVEVANAQDSTHVNVPQDGPPDSTQNSSVLENFRKAFSKVVDKKNKHHPSEQDPELELGGFVLDETRSKMGRDFYELFYQKWKAPKNAGNYTLTITEQPSIGRGSLVTLKLDYERIFSARLQPRYEYIEAVSEQAVQRVQQIMQQQSQVQEQLSGF